MKVHSDNGEMVVVTLSSEREVQVGTKHAAGKMKAGRMRFCFNVMLRYSYVKVLAVVAVGK